VIYKPCPKSYLFDKLDCLRLAKFAFVSQQICQSTARAKIGCQTVQIANFEVVVHPNNIEMLELTVNFDFCEYLKIKT
jgi:hypothetical protein